MPARNTRNVVLTERHMRFVDELVRSGRYQNASEVMREGLRALEDRLRREEADLAEIRARIGRSIAELDRGEYIEGTAEEVIGGVFDRALADADR